jgi:hypothetical protein
MGPEERTCSLPGDAGDANGKSGRKAAFLPAFHRLGAIPVLALCGQVWYSTGRTIRGFERDFRPSPIPSISPV